MGNEKDELVPNPSATTTKNEPQTAGDVEEMSVTGSEDVEMVVNDDQQPGPSGLSGTRQPCLPRGIIRNFEILSKLVGSVSQQAKLSRKVTFCEESIRLTKPLPEEISMEDSSLPVEPPTTSASASQKFVTPRVMCPRRGVLAKLRKKHPNFPKFYIQNSTASKRQVITIGPYNIFVLQRNRWLRTVEFGAQTLVNPPKKFTYRKYLMHKSHWNSMLDAALQRDKSIQHAIQPEKIYKNTLLEDLMFDPNLLFMEKYHRAQGPKVVEPIQHSPMFFFFGKLDTDNQPNNASDTNAGPPRRFFNFTNYIRNIPYETKPLSFEDETVKTAKHDLYCQIFKDIRKCEPYKSMEKNEVLRILLGKLPVNYIKVCSDAFIPETIPENIKIDNVEQNLVIRIYSTITGECIQAIIMPSILLPYRFNAKCRDRMLKDVIHQLRSAQGCFPDFLENLRSGNVLYFLRFVQIRITMLMVTINTCELQTLGRVAKELVRKDTQKSYACSLFTIPSSLWLYFSSLSKNKVHRLLAFDASRDVLMKNCLKERRMIGADISTVEPFMLRSAYLSTFHQMSVFRFFLLGPKCKRTVKNELSFYSYWLGEILRAVKPENLALFSEKSRSALRYHILLGIYLDPLLRMRWKKKYGGLPKQFPTKLALLTEELARFLPPTVLDMFKSFGLLEEQTEGAPPAETQNRSPAKVVLQAIKYIMRNPAAMKVIRDPKTRTMSNRKAIKAVYRSSGMVAVPYKRLLTVLNLAFPLNSSEEMKRMKVSVTDVPAQEPEPRNNINLSDALRKDLLSYTLCAYNRFNRRVLPLRKRDASRKRVSEVMTEILRNPAVSEIFSGIEGEASVPRKQAKPSTDASSSGTNRDIPRSSPANISVNRHTAFSRLFEESSLASNCPPSTSSHFLNSPPSTSSQASTSAQLQRNLTSTANPFFREAPVARPPDPPLRKTFKDLSDQKNSGNPGDPTVIGKVPADIRLENMYHAKRIIHSNNLSKHPRTYTDELLSIVHLPPRRDPPEMERTPAGPSQENLTPSEIFERHREERMLEHREEQPSQERYVGPCRFDGKNCKTFYDMQVEMIPRAYSMVRQPAPESIVQEIQFEFTSNRNLPDEMIIEAFPITQEPLRLPSSSGITLDLRSPTFMRRWTSNYQIEPIVGNEQSNNSRSQCTSSTEAGPSTSQAENVSTESDGEPAYKPIEYPPIPPSIDRSSRNMINLMRSLTEPTPEEISGENTGESWSCVIDDQVKSSKYALGEKTELAQVYTTSENDEKLTKILKIEESSWSRSTMYVKKMMDRLKIQALSPAEKNTTRQEVLKALENLKRPDLQTDKITMEQCEKLLKMLQSKVEPVISKNPIDTMFAIARRDGAALNTTTSVTEKDDGSVDEAREIRRTSAGKFLTMRPQQQSEVIANGLSKLLSILQGGQLYGSQSRTRKGVKVPYMTREHWAIGYKMKTNMRPLGSMNYIGGQPSINLYKSPGTEFIIDHIQNDIKHNSSHVDAACIEKVRENLNDLNKFLNDDFKFIETMMDFQSKIPKDHPMEKIWKDAPVEKMVKEQICVLHAKLQSLSSALSIVVINQMRDSLERLPHNKSTIFDLLPEEAHSKEATCEAIQKLAIEHVKAQLDVRMNTLQKILSDVPEAKQGELFYNILDDQSLKKVVTARSVHKEVMDMFLAHARRMFSSEVYQTLKDALNDKLGTTKTRMAWDYVAEFASLHKQGFLKEECNEKIMVKKNAIYLEKKTQPPSTESAGKETNIPFEVRKLAYENITANSRFSKGDRKTLRSLLIEKQLSHERLAKIFPPELILIHDKIIKQTSTEEEEHIFYGTLHAIAQKEQQVLDAKFFNDFFPPEFQYPPFENLKPLHIIPPNLEQELEKLRDGKLSDHEMKKFRSQLSRNIKSVDEETIQQLVDGTYDMKKLAEEIKDDVMKQKITASYKQALAEKRQTVDIVSKDVPDLYKSRSELVFQGKAPESVYETLQKEMDIVNPGTMLRALQWHMTPAEINLLEEIVEGKAQKEERETFYNELCSRRDYDPDVKEDLRKMIESELSDSYLRDFFRKIIRQLRSPLESSEIPRELNQFSINNEPMVKATIDAIPDECREDLITSVVDDDNASPLTKLLFNRVFVPHLRQETITDEEAQKAFNKLTEYQVERIHAFAGEADPLEFVKYCMFTKTLYWDDTDPWKGLKAGRDNGIRKLYGRIRAAKKKVKIENEEAPTSEERAVLEALAAQASQSSLFSDSDIDALVKNIQESAKHISPETLAKVSEVLRQNTSDVDMQSVDQTSAMSLIASMSSEPLALSASIFPPSVSFEASQSIPPPPPESPPLPAPPAALTASTFSGNPEVASPLENIISEILHDVPVSIDLSSEIINVDSPPPAEEMIIEESQPVQPEVQNTTWTVDYSALPRKDRKLLDKGKVDKLVDRWAEERKNAPWPRLPCNCYWCGKRCSRKQKHRKPNPDVPKETPKFYFTKGPVKPTVRQPTVKVLKKTKPYSRKSDNAPSTSKMDNFTKTHKRPDEPTKSDSFIFTSPKLPSVVKSGTTVKKDKLIKRKSSFSREKEDISVEKVPEATTDVAAPGGSHTTEDDNFSDDSTYDDLTPFSRKTTRKEAKKTYNETTSSPAKIMTTITFKKAKKHGYDVSSIPVDTSPNAECVVPMVKTVFRTISYKPEEEKRIRQIATVDSEDENDLNIHINKYAGVSAHLASTYIEPQESAEDSSDQNEDIVFYEDPLHKFARIPKKENTATKSKKRIKTLEHLDELRAIMLVLTLQEHDLPDDLKKQLPDIEYLKKAEIFDKFALEDRVTFLIRKYLRVWGNIKRKMKTVAKPLCPTCDRRRAYGNYLRYGMMRLPRDKRGKKIRISIKPRPGSPYQDPPVPPFDPEVDYSHRATQAYRPVWNELLRNRLSKNKRFKNLRRLLYGDIFSNVGEHVWDQRFAPANYSHDREFCDGWDLILQSEPRDKRRLMRIYDELYYDEDEALAAEGHEVALREPTNFVQTLPLMGDMAWHKIIMDYLIFVGDGEAARAFSRESAINLSSADLEALERRGEARRSIIMGRMEEAYRMIESLCPELMRDESVIRHQFHIQAIAEMISKPMRSVPQIIDYANRYFSNESSVATSQLRKLEKTMSLLAFPDPHQSPFKDILDPKLREVVAANINQCLLEKMNKRSNAQLEAFLKLSIWAESMLRKERSEPELPAAEVAKIVFKNI